MASKNKLYTVIARRYNNHESHAYLVGVFDKKNKGIAAADCETEYRGGKYSCDVLECVLNSKATDDFKIVHTAKGLEL